MLSVHSSVSDPVLLCQRGRGVHYKLICGRAWWEGLVVAVVVAVVIVVDVGAVIPVYF